jgi:predicted PurR-regulated permease PerM
MSPDWLGSPQHAVAGALLGAAAIAFARRRIQPTWLALAFALGVVALAELLVELVEYPLLYGADAHARAYYDTIADLAATLAGGVVGALAAVVVPSRRSSK